MRRAAVVLVVWGVWLGVMTAIATPFGPRSIEVGLLGASAASSVVTC